MHRMKWRYRFAGTGEIVSAVRRPRVNAPLLLLLCGIGLFHYLTMPSFLYPGDNFAPRAECAYWLSTGQWGIPYTMKPMLGDLWNERGQYFFENDAKQRMFSKYGFGYTLFYIPPLLAEKLRSGYLDILSKTRCQVFYLNIYQVLLTILIAAYLYKIISFYAQRPWVRVFFVLASFYTTFFWHYLRSPTTEIYHILTFLGFYYHMLRFLRGCERSEQRDSATWRHLGYATAYAGYSVLIKHSFSLLLGAAWLFAGLAGPLGVPLLKRLRLNSTRYLVRNLLYIGLPSLLFVGAFIAINLYRCGDPLETGYGQWVSETTHQPIANLSWRNIPDAAKGFLYRSGNGNANVFIHYPLLVFALFGYGRFLRRAPLDGAFLLFVVGANFLVVLWYSFWEGEWCYGPRYVLHPLIIASLPVIETGRAVWESRKNLVRSMAVATAVFVLGGSLMLQYYMNSLPYFTYYDVSALFARSKQESVRKYFDTHWHRGILHRDLMRYLDGKAPYYPLEEVKKMYPPQDHAMLETRVHDALNQIARPNYYFFP